MRLAVMEFTRVEIPNEVAGQSGQSYVECRLIDPPIEFAVGTGINLLDAFNDMRARIFDTAIYSARLLHDDPEEWKRRSESEPQPESEPEPLNLRLEE